MHLPWTEKMTKDDRRLESVKHFEGKEVVVTVKLDGENTSMYRDHIHARSLEHNAHPSKKWVKGLWGRIAYEIPDGWRLCGEDMYAIHTIPYKNLESYFYLFSIWNERNVCLSWDETLEYAELLGLKTVPVLYRGLWDEEKIKKLFKSEIDGNACEGYVVRIANEFSYGDFRRSVSKFVSGDFKIKHGHWAQRQIFANELKHE